MSTSLKEPIRDRFTSFLRENGLIVVLVILYISCYRFWENLIADLFIIEEIDNGNPHKGLLYYFESNWQNDIIFYLAILGCLVLFCLNWRRRIRRKTIIISIVAVLFWIYYRFISQRFGFISLHSFTLLKYIDIVPIYAGSVLLSALQWKVVNFEINIWDKNGFMRDAPINYATVKNLDELDSSKRVELAGKAVTWLLQTNTSEGCFTFGIDAPWGAGKSSFMNIMKKLISDNEGTITIEFNPWLYASEKDLLTAFQTD